MRTAILVAVLSVALVCAAPCRADFATTGSIGDGAGTKGSTNYSFAYDDPFGNSAFGTLETVDSGMKDGSLLAIGGSLTLTSTAAASGLHDTYSLNAAGPQVTLSPGGLFIVDNRLFTANDAQ